MRKSVWLAVMLFLSACTVPFLNQPAEPTEMLVPTMAEPATEAVEPAIAVTPVAVEVLSADEDAMPVVDAVCQGELESCQAAATEMAATIVAFEAFGGNEATATPDMSDGIPVLTPTPTTDPLGGGLPTLTPTINPISGGLPTATVEVVPLETEESNYRADAVTYKKNFAHPDKGCNWMGVAGQVMDIAGNPVKDLVVVAEGVLQGEEVLQVDITGLHGAYGPGGYEIELGNAVISTTNMVYITLYDLDGTKLSSAVSIATRADCNQNLLILNFQQQ